MSIPSSWDWGQIVIKLGTKYVMYQKLANLCRKRISVLTGVKVSYLKCKCVFYRPENNVKKDPMKLNFSGLEMQN